MTKVTDVSVGKNILEKKMVDDIYTVRIQTTERKL